MKAKNRRIHFPSLSPQHRVLSVHDGREQVALSELWQPFQPSFLGQADIVLMEVCLPDEWDKFRCPTAEVLGGSVSLKSEKGTLIMQFKREASVCTSDGHDVGCVDCVVLNPRTKEVTHIVVRKGFLFTEDKLVPLSLVASADGERVTLRPGTEDLNDPPPFEETHYVPLDEDEARASAYSEELASPVYWYPMSGVWSYPVQPPSYLAETEQNIPEDTVAVKEGAKVVSADGKDLGRVERVLTTPSDDRAAYFLVSQGVIQKHNRLVPLTWVQEVAEDEVHLSVRETLFETLRDYQEAQP